MAVLARVSVFFAEYALPQRCKQGTDIRGSLTADKARQPQTPDDARKAFDALFKK